MSLVIGYCDALTGKVWMASDGLATFGCAQVETVKIRRYHGDLLVGTTGLHRLNNIILDLHAPTAELPGRLANPYAFAVRFAQDLRVRCKDAGILTVNKEGQEDMGGRVLLGYNGRLFGVSSDFAVIEHAPWWAIGCGCEWAEGALAALDKLKTSLTPRDRLLLVLELVASRDIHVAPPYTVLSSGATE